MNTMRWDYLHLASWFFTLYLSFPSAANFIPFSESDREPLEKDQGIKGLLKKKNEKADKTIVLLSLVK